MNEVLDLPPIDADMINTTGPAPTPPAPMTAVAVAGVPPAAVDLTKIDLTDVALAQFGDWRPAVAKLKADNLKTVHDLSTQTKIADAISLRQRTTNQPKADANKTATILKSKLAQTSKRIGEEVAALIAGYDDAATPLTEQIDAAQKKLDDEKEAKRLADRLLTVRPPKRVALTNLLDLVADGEDDELATDKHGAH